VADLLDSVDLVETNQGLAKVAEAMYPSEEEYARLLNQKEPKD